MKAKNITLKILKILISIYLILCCVACVFWIYFKFFKPDSFTNSAIYANEVEDINGKKCVMEINSYNNLFEVKFNYYADYNSTDVISSGVQILNFKDLKSGTYNTQSFPANMFVSTNYFSYMAGTNGKENYNSKNLCFYEESDNISYKAINSTLEEFGCFKIEIDGTSYALQLGRTKTTNITYFPTHITQEKSSFSRIIQKMYEIYHDGIQDAGEHYQTFKFQDYFDVYKFDGKKYEKVEADIFDTYFYVKVTNYNEDAKTAKDSIFGQVQYNSNWTNGEQDNLLNEYFSDRNLFKLTEQNCKFTFNETTNKHIANINDATYNEYKDKNLNFALVLDLDYLEEIGVIFGGVENDGNIKDLNITSYYTLTNGNLTEVQINV